MTDREALLQLIKDRAVVHGKVVLSSGREADYYVDLRRVTLDAEAAPLIGRVMLDLVADLDIDAVGGLTLGADPVALAMLHQAAAAGRELDAFVVRKEAKAHGMQRRIEGPDIAGRRVLAVEDTSTTGGTLAGGGRGAARGGRRGGRGGRHRRAGRGARGRCRRLAVLRRVLAVRPGPGLSRTPSRSPAADRLTGGVGQGGS